MWDTSHGANPVTGPLLSNSPFEAGWTTSGPELISGVSPALEKKEKKKKKKKRQLGVFKLAQKWSRILFIKCGDSVFY